MEIQSKACCTRPPVVLRGGYDGITSGENYTGPPDAKRGIFLICDVFGMFIQSLYGADIMAYGYDALPDSAGQYQVFMPDFFGDNPQDMTNFPPKTPKQFKAIQDFMTVPALPSKTVKLILPLLEAFKQKHPEITSWCIHGFCWCGKVAALVSQKGTPFKAAGQSHPSLLQLDDAKKVAVPMVVLPSQDEVPELVDRWCELLKEACPQSYTELFGDRFMAG